MNVNIGKMVITIEELETEALQKKGNKLDDSSEYLGLFDCREQTIYLDSTLLPIQKRRTLRHELVHAFIFSYGFMNRAQGMDEEGICEFIAVYGSDIEDIVREYFNHVPEG